MQPNSETIVISDTSCLILLSAIGELDILKQLSSKVFITSTIKSEFGLELPDWILVKDPNPSPFQTILEKEIDAGEISAILLAMETTSSLLVIDDLRGRKVAQRLKVRYSGTLGLLLKAKQMGFIPELAPILEKVKKTNFRFDDQLLKQLKKAAGE